MTNKTAMQTLIDWLDSEDCLLDAYSISHIKEQIEPNLFATERQQIIDTFTSGQISIAETLFAEYKERGFQGDITMPENDKEDGIEYYQQTFGNSQNTQQ